jgi:hypothetical protein
VLGLGVDEEDAMKSAYGLIALTIAGVAALYGASAAQSNRAFENVSVLRAQKIELVDVRGATRARLSAESDGEVVLRLMAPNGELRVKLGAAKEGSGLLLANAATEPGVHILAQGSSATLKLKAGESERVLEP